MTYFAYLDEFGHIGPYLSRTTHVVGCLDYETRGRYPDRSFLTGPVGYGLFHFLQSEGGTAMLERAEQPADGPIG